MDLTSTSSTEIGLDDLWVLLNFGRGTLCDLFPIIQYGDEFRDTHYDPHLMFDEKDRDPQLITEVPDKIHHIPRLSRIHACCGFVEEQEFGTSS
jgi:hypothetical protein